MKVYVVEVKDFDEWGIVGVYSTEEKAREIQVEKSRGGIDDSHVSEWVVDAAPNA